MSKTFKNLIEADLGGYTPKGGDERDFVARHPILKFNHPVATEAQFKGFDPEDENPKGTRTADKSPSEQEYDYANYLDRAMSGIDSGMEESIDDFLDFLESLDDDELDQFLEDNDDLTESVETEAAEIRKNAPGYVGSDFAAKASDADIVQMKNLKDNLAPIVNSINALRKKYKLKSLGSLKESAYEGDLKDNEPRIVTGVYGARSKPFKKKFRNQAAQDRFFDHPDNEGNYEIEYVMREGLEEQEYDGGTKQAELVASLKNSVASAIKSAEKSMNMGDWRQAGRIAYKAHVTLDKALNRATPSAPKDRKAVAAMLSGLKKTVGLKEGFSNLDEIISEGVIKDLQNISSKNQKGSVKLNDGTKIAVDLTTANLMTQIYDKLDSTRKSKFEDAMSKDEEGFMKMMDFAYKQLKNKK